MIKLKNDTKKLFIGIAVGLGLIFTYMLIQNYRSNKMFPELFKDYNYTYCTTIVDHPQKGTSQIEYRYVVNNITYRYWSSFSFMKHCKVPGGKYLIVYSCLDPTYHVLLGREINSDKDLESIDIPKSYLKSKFTVDERAKIYTDNK